MSPNDDFCFEHHLPPTQPPLTPMSPGRHPTAAWPHSTHPRSGKAERRCMQRTLGGRRRGNGPQVPDFERCGTVTSDTRRLGGEAGDSCLPGGLCEQESGSRRKPLGHIFLSVIFDNRLFPQEQEEESLVAENCRWARGPGRTGWHSGGGAAPRVLHVAAVSEPFLRQRTGKTC